MEPALDKKNITILAYSNGPGWKAVRENVTFAQAGKRLSQSSSRVGENISIRTKNINHLMQNLSLHVISENNITNEVGAATYIK